MFCGGYWSIHHCQRTLARTTYYRTMRTLFVGTSTQPKATIAGVQPLPRRKMGRRTWFLMSLGLFLNAKEPWQTTFNIRTLLIDNEIKYSRPNRWPARSANGRAGGLANMFLLEFWGKIVRRCLRKHPYIHIWVRNAFCWTCILGALMH